VTNAAGSAPQLTRKDIEAKIVALAWQDDDFRRKFVADPKGQFEARIGTKLPASLKMTVHEESENSLHFVIPSKPKTDISELSDTELEKIAGGTDILTTIAVFASIGVSVGGVVAGSVGATKGGWV